MYHLEGLYKWLHWCINCVATPNIRNTVTQFRFNRRLWAPGAHLLFAVWLCSLSYVITQAQRKAGGEFSSSTYRVRSIFFLLPGKCQQFSHHFSKNKIPSRTQAIYYLFLCPWQISRLFLGEPVYESKLHGRAAKVSRVLCQDHYSWFIQKKNKVLSG